MPRTTNRADLSPPARAVIECLARNQAMTVADLVREMGVTTTAVRQKLYKLIADGWIVVTKRRGGPGRPADLLSLSDQARELFGVGQADELIRTLLSALFEQENADWRHVLLRSVSAKMACELRRAAGDAPFEQRAQRIADLMRRRGLLVDVAVSGESARLNVFTCPYPEMAGAHRELCELEREALRDASGNEVTLEKCMLDGHRCCSFHLAGASVPQTA